MRAVHVVRPGLLTTVQDEGRWGYQALGVPVSGAMDLHSHAAANRLVGNHLAAATLEITIVGPVLRIEEPAWIAVAGAPCAARLDGTACDVPFRVRAGAGAVLELGSCAGTGSRAYVAFDGGISVPPVLGSRATDVRSRLGGLAGRPLTAGDVLPLGEAARSVPSWAPSDDRALPTAAAITRLRIVPGPQPEPIAALCGRTFTVSPHADRTGYRLQERLDRGSTGDLVSAPTTTGAVQVTPSGDVILLMADRQTNGGYAQAAVVITADLPRAGQLAPGFPLEFVQVSLDDAMRAQAGLRHSGARND